MTAMTFSEILGRNTPGVIPELWDSCPFKDDPDFLALTVRQQKFIVGYGLRDLRGWTFADCAKFACPMPITQASASTLGGTLSQHKKIVPFLRKWDRILVERFTQGTDRIWQEEQSIAFSDIIDYLDEDGLIDPVKLRNLPRSTTAAIASIEILRIPSQDGGPDKVKYKLKLWDKSSSLARMERMRAMNAPEKVIFQGVQTNIDGGIDPKEAAKIYSEMIRATGGETI